MELDCAHADVKFCADLGVCASPGQREQDSLFAFGQSFDGLDSYGSTRAGRETREEPRRDPGIDQGVAIKRHSDSLDQLLWCGALEKKPSGAALSAP